jgi:uncharacterized membrane protein SpoIIM required for sporulation
MMTPLQFEQLYENEWLELELLLNQVAAPARAKAVSAAPVSGARVALLYRRACEHLALSRARAYPAYLVDRLERLTADAHQLIYHRREAGAARLKRLIAAEFPAAVRAHSSYVALATAVFIVPTILVALVVYWRPELILSVVSAETAASFEDMYSPGAESIGRIRTASTDWAMFGFYIRNNIGVAFQCFAGGLFTGLGTLFFLAYNGVFSGALAGYLVQRGLSPTFFSFVATHSAFELTAIVLSGAAGLRIGHALIAPGRMRRREALVRAAEDTATLLYGITVMLVVAAGVEAFWSSASWIPPGVKYAVAAACWTAVILYFTRQGRHAG